MWKGKGQKGVLVPPSSPYNPEAPWPSQFQVSGLGPCCPLPACNSPILIGTSVYHTDEAMADLRRALSCLVTGK